MDTITLHTASIVDTVYINIEVLLLSYTWTCVVTFGVNHGSVYQDIHMCHSTNHC